MKLYKFFVPVILAIAIMVIGVSCTKVGPPGPAGTAGADGLNGMDANSTCLTCHTTANWAAKTAQYQLSKHYYGTTSTSRNVKYCARCHTNEGFQEITGDGKFVVNNDIPDATRITCETCHTMTTFQFGKDTIANMELVLRTTTPVWLNYYNNLKTQDFGTVNNLCCTCHQIRGVTSVNFTDTLGKVQTFNQLPYFPLDVTKQNTTVKYTVGTNFAVHDGNQSNLFAGINGYEFSGQTYTRTWQHSGNRCTDCHMNTFDPVTKTGGHSLIVNKAACTACHGSDKLTPIQTEISGLLVQLGDALVAKKLFSKSVNSSGVASYSAVPSHDFYGNLFPTTSSTKLFYTALASANTVSATTGLVVYGNTVTKAVDSGFATRIGREWKYGELGAAYNYGYVNGELSIGIHNHTYAKQLLQTSIAWLQAN